MLGSKKMPRRSFVLRSRRSLKGISCCSISFILGSLLSRGEIFFRRKLFLRELAALRGFGPRGPESDDAGAAFHVVTDFDEQLGIAREPQVGARAEAHEADAFTASDAVAGFFPADNATGDEPGDLLEGEVACVGGERNDVLFVIGGSALAHGGGKLAGRI